MKKLARVFCLAAAAVMLLAGNAFGADTFTEAEINKIMNDKMARVDCYQNIDSISVEEFKKLKPEIESAEYTELRFSGVDPNDLESYYYDENIRITLKPLPGYEKYKDIMMAANFDGYELYMAKSKDGKYKSVLLETFYAEINSKFIKNSYVPVCSYIMQANSECTGRAYGPRYFKVRFFKKIDGEEIYTKWSDVYESYWPMAAPGNASDAAKIAKNKIFVEFYKKDGIGRNLQIREKGASKWVSVSKSKLVDKVEYSQYGCTLSLDTSKDYEFRARYTYKENGKTKYSLERINWNLCNPTFKVKNVSFLQYDKNRYALRCDVLEDYEERKELELKGGYEAVCRKAGSNDKWKKVTAEWIRDTAGRVCFEAKPGYEYKVRLFYDELSGGNKAYGPYSKVFKCTKANSKYVNNLGVCEGRWDYAYLKTENDAAYPVYSRPAYNRAETISENYETIRSFITSHYERMDGAGLVTNFGDRYGHTVRIDMSRTQNNKVGVVAMNRRTVSGMDSGAIIECLWFFTGNQELSNALYCWKEAAVDYGNANSDYFGFRDVKNTSNGFVIEGYGQQIEVEFGDDGTIYWIDIA